MTLQLGDFSASAMIDFKWNAVSGLGGSITRSTDGSIRIYKANSVTQRSSANGITDSEDFDSLTGLNHLRIDLSDNTDAGFYAAGSEYQVVLQGAVIDGQTLNAVLASFSIERAGNFATILARLPTALVSGRIDASVGAMASAVVTAAAIATDAITAAKIADGAIDAATFAAGAINAAAIATDAITDAKVASDVTIASVTGAVGSVTGAVGSVTGAVGSVTGAIGSIATGGIVAASFGAGAINAAAIATDAITAAKIAADAIGASELAADAVTEIQSGLATAAALTVVDDFLDTEVGAIITTLGTPVVSLAADIAAIEAQTDDIGAAGAGLTAVPWNADWDAEVQSEVDDALIVQRLDELLNADSDIDGAAPPTVGSVVHEMLTKTAGSFTYDQTTDSLEAVRDRGDAAWTTAAGFATAAALATAQTSIDDLPTNAELATALGTADDAVLAQVALVKAKTDNLPSDPADASVIAGRFDTLDTSVADLPTNAELATSQAAADDATLAAIAALNNLSAADVNAEVVDALATDTYAEPTGVPAATATIATKISWLHMALRNKVTISATKKTFYDDGDAAEWEKDLSDDGDVYTETEASAI